LKKVEPLRWKGDRLELLDQRLLPDQTKYVVCRTAADVAKAIRDMVVRGAPAIGCAAAFGVVLGKGSAKAYELLAKSRPTAVNLFWALDRMRRTAAAHRDLPLARVKARLLEEAGVILKEDIAANRAMGAHGAALVPQGGRVLTHCNAGALATAGYGTALGVIRAAHEQKKLAFVWVDETRPVMQGSRLTAWEMAKEGIPHRLIADVAAGTAMRQGLVDLVVTGADRIARNGDTANKIGTYGVAVLARHHGIPFYVAAPWSTIDVAIDSGAAIAIEERDAAEVRGVAGRQTAPSDSPIWNPAFDVTPAELIAAVVTEEGVHRRPYAESLPSRVGA